MAIEFNSRMTKFRAHRKCFQRTFSGRPTNLFKKAHICLYFKEAATGTTCDPMLIKWNSLPKVGQSLLHNQISSKVAL